MSKFKSQELKAKAGQTHYTRAIKLRVDGVLESTQLKAKAKAGVKRKKTHKKSSGSGNGTKKNSSKQLQQPKLTTRKVKKINEMCRAVVATVNFYIRELRLNCLNVSLDKRKLSAEELEAMRVAQEPEWQKRQLNKLIAKQKSLAKRIELKRKELDAFSVVVQTQTEGVSKELKAQIAKLDRLKLKIAQDEEQLKVAAAQEEWIQHTTPPMPIEEVKRPNLFGLDKYTLDFLSQQVKWYESKDPSFLEQNKLKTPPTHHILKSINSLTERLKSQCLKKALEMLKAVDNSEKERAIQAKTNKRHAKCPVLKANAGINLDAKFVQIKTKQRGEVKEDLKEFDIVLNLSVLKDPESTSAPAKSRMPVMLKGTKVLNKWLSKPGADLLDGCEFIPGYVIVYVRVPVKPLFEDNANENEWKSYREQLLSQIKGIGGDKATVHLHEVAALDLGIHKLAVCTNIHHISEVASSTQGPCVEPIPSEDTSFSLFFGQAWQDALLDKRLRKKWGSKAFKRASLEHQNLIEMELNKLPYQKIKILIVENLTHIKKYKTSKRVQLWLVSFLLERLTAKCMENRVLLEFVNPANTSKTCPMCRTVRTSNRQAEAYYCKCSEFPVIGLDADFVGAYNIRRRFLESVKWYSHLTACSFDDSPFLSFAEQDVP